MGFGTPPTVLEGDYSTWTEKWATSVDDIGIAWNEAFFNIEGDRICFVSKYKAYLLKLSTGELLDTKSISAYGTNVDLVVSSILGKYLVITYDDYIEIYKDGVLKQTITPEAGDTIQGVGISSDGKYIAIGLGTADKVYCYEGS